MKITEPQIPLTILLADDDVDDCIFFKGALAKSFVLTNFIAVHNGKELMEVLMSDTRELPDALFIDLNMPRKNGFECLSEIKLTAKLKHIPVIMYSTSNDQGVVDRLYDNGAQYFIRKPSMISQFEEIIHRTLILIAKRDLKQPAREHFKLELEIELS